MVMEREFLFIIHYSGSWDPGGKVLGYQTQRGNKFHFTIDFYSYCISSSLCLPRATWIMDFLSSSEFNVQLQLSLQYAHATNMASEIPCPDISQQTYLVWGGWGWLLSDVQLNGMIQMTYRRPHMRLVTGSHILTKRKLSPREVTQLDQGHVAT